LVCATLWLCPATLGTPTDGGPLDTTSLTVEPLGARPPADGVVKITASGATTRSGCDDRLDPKPTALSLWIATFADSPSTLGTVIRACPEEPLDGGPGVEALDGVPGLEALGGVLGVEALGGVPGGLEIAIRLRAGGPLETCRGMPTSAAAATLDASAAGTGLGETTKGLVTTAQPAPNPTAATAAVRTKL
jgi:hypothetical protein